MKYVLLLLLAPHCALACPVMNGEFFCADSAEAIKIATHKNSTYTQYAIKTTKLEKLDEEKSESLSEGRASPVASLRPVKCVGDQRLNVYERDAESGGQIVTFYFLDAQGQLHRGRSIAKAGSDEPLDPASIICRRIK